MLNKHILIALFVFFIFVGGAVWLLPAWGEYQRTKVRLLEQQEEVQQEQIRNERLRQEIDRLKTDDRAKERVARNKFGWCKENEKVYDFDER